MSEIVNLNRTRKTRDREDRQNIANTNAVKFGRSKAERISEAVRSDQARRMLDQHKLDEE